MSSKKTLYTLILFSWILAACGAKATPAPTPDLDALRTSVAQTVVAQITATAAAAPQPTATRTATPTRAPAPTPAATITPTPPCYQAEYVADVTIPDYYNQLQPGELFVKTWKIKNTGSCAWTPGFKLVFGYGEKMNGKTQPINAEVPPGSSIEVSVTLTAPQKAGTYTGAWRMSNDLGDPFGDFLLVVIVMP